MMMRIAAVALTVVLAATTPNKCQNQGGSTDGGNGNGNGGNPPPAGRVYACDTTLDKPYRGTFNKKPAIIAASHSKCDKTPTTHVVNVGMDVKIGSTWQPVSTFDGTLARTCTDIPHGGALTGTTCPVTVPCVVPGIYRTRVLVTGNGPADANYPSGKPFTFVVPEDQEPEAGISCN